MVGVTAPQAGPAVGGYHRGCPYGGIIAQPLQCELHNRHLCFERLQVAASKSVPPQGVNGIPQMEPRRSFFLAGGEGAKGSR